MSMRQREERSGTLYGYGGKLVCSYRMGRWEFLGAGSFQALRGDEVLGDEVLGEEEQGWSLALGLGHRF